MLAKSLQVWLIRYHDSNNQQAKEKNIYILVLGHEPTTLQRTFLIWVFIFQMFYSLNKLFLVLNDIFFLNTQNHTCFQCVFYLWPRCWAEVPQFAGSTVGLPGWRNPSSSDSWWWAGWWRPCPAGWWWHLAVAASWPVHKTQSSLFPDATLPRPVTSPSSEPAACKE